MNLHVTTHALQRLRVWDKAGEHLDVQDHHVGGVLLSTVSGGQAEQQQRQPAAELGAPAARRSPGLLLADSSQGLDHQREFGSCVGAVGLWCDLHLESGDCSGRRDVIVKRDLRRRRTREV